MCIRDSGKVDVGAAGMTVTEERQASVDFTNTYAKASQMIIVKEGSEIACLLYTSRQVTCMKTLKLQIKAHGKLWRICMNPEKSEELD